MQNMTSDKKLIKDEVREHKDINFAIKSAQNTNEEKLGINLQQKRALFTSLMNNPMPKINEN